MSTLPGKKTSEPQEERSTAAAARDGDTPLPSPRKESIRQEADDDEYDDEDGESAGRYDPEELAGRLQPHLPPWAALGLPHLIVTLLFCVLFFVSAFAGVRPLELFSHVVYGEWMISNGGLPQTDPFLKFAAGMPVDHSAWLSQVITAGVYRMGGGEALSSVFSFLKVAVFVVFAIVVFLRTRNLAAVGGCVGFLALAYGFRLLETPIDILGQLAFMTLLVIMTRDEQPDAKASPKSQLFVWIAVPALFALWVNLHVSYALGLMLLAAWALGRGWDAWRQTGDIGQAVNDGQFRRRVWLTELALAATLLNPGLWGAWTQAINTAFNANVRDQAVYSWLSFSGYAGLVMAGCILLMMVVLRKAKDIRGFDVLAFVVFAAAAAISAYLTPWLAVVTLVIASERIVATCCRPRESSDEDTTADLGATSAKAPSIKKESLPADALLAMEDDDDENALPEGRSFLYTLVCILVAWLTVIFTPTYDLVVNPGETKRTPQQLFGVDSPWIMAEPLREISLDGTIYAPLSWAGFLQVEGRAADAPLSNQYFANAMVNHLPRRVWTDYMVISSASNGWESTLERYDVRHIFADRDSQRQLVEEVLNSPNWFVHNRTDEDAPLWATHMANMPPLEDEAESSDSNESGEAAAVEPSTDQTSEPQDIDQAEANDGDANDNDTGNGDGGA